MEQHFLIAHSLVQPGSHDTRRWKGTCVVCKLCCCLYDLMLCQTTLLYSARSPFGATQRTSVPVAIFGCKGNWGQLRVAGPLLPSLKSRAGESESRLAAERSRRLICSLCAPLSLQRLPDGKVKLRLRLRLVNPTDRTR